MHFQAIPTCTEQGPTTPLEEGPGIMVLEFPTHPITSITNNYSQLANGLLFIQNIVELLMNKIAIKISIRANDWTVQCAIISKGGYIIATGTAVRLRMIMESCLVSN